MKELKKFREFLNEEKFKVGDKVTMKSGGDEMEVTKARRMFGSKIDAYSVKKSDGEEVEYDEGQLKLAEESFGSAGTDKRSGQVIGDILQLIRDTGIDPSDVLEEIGQEFGIAFEFGRGYNTREEPKNQYGLNLDQINVTD
jgi:uncharacterized protein YodC (DUF2158 family)|tara:strand:- start:265 stop:687 length:423 start_codon:yes stop_codon:yes gene_type:complete